MGKKRVVSMVLENVDRQSRKGRRNPNHTQARRSGVYVQMGIKKNIPLL